MNFLGHFYLSGNKEGLILGNFIADFVKGKDYLKYPKDIAEGILLHREIDSFTDAHESFKQSRKRVSRNQLHFSGVVIDVFYDHYLASDFAAISGYDLDEFVQNIYSIIDKHHDVLPIQTKYLYKYMKRDNWLERYSFIEGIEKTLRGLSRRVKFKNNMAEAIKDLEEHYIELQNDFCEFIADAREKFNPLQP